jgi:hypothetical protein
MTPRVLAAWVLALLLGGPAWADVTQGDAAPAKPEAAPVLVELFTSGGRAPCAAAESLLSLLATKQPIKGARIIPVIECVTAGGAPSANDRLALSAWAARHHQYATALGHERAQTPQLIVDGGRELAKIGRADLERAVKAAAGSPKPLTVVVKVLAPDPDAPPDSNVVRVRVGARPIPAPGDSLAVQAAPGDNPAEVVLFLTEDGATVDMEAAGGANTVMSGVVRICLSVGQWGHGGPSQGTAYVRAITLDAGWDRRNLHLIAVVQESGNRRVLGVAEIPLQQ